MKLVVGNFKMNLSLNEINDYLNLWDRKNFDNVVFCPSALYLQSFIKHHLSVGIQDIGFTSSGAYTGDISALQAKSIGVSYAIIGHSERRLYYDDAHYVNKKVKLCLENDLIPIVCIGEKEHLTFEETYYFLKTEIDEAIDSCSNPEKIIIAYEPIWAIGTGLVPSNIDIFNTINYIKNYIYDKYGFNINVLYGGSVNNHNITDLIKISNVDGYLVGGCSINALSFLELINRINK